MAAQFSSPFLQFFFVFVFLLYVGESLSWQIHGSSHGKERRDDGCIAALIVMGASMVDVGQNAAAMPLRSPSEFPPYGMDFFPRPAKRFSNGRLFIDFISQGLGYGFLDPYLKSVGSNFQHGVNFASSGSTARNSSISGDGNTSRGLFSLQVQISQFIDFKHAVMAASHQSPPQLMKGKRHLPSLKDLANAVFFLETGHNDYLHAYSSEPFDRNGLVAAVISAMENALKVLYREGARNIITMNLIPLGCTPRVLATFNDSGLDEYGCHVKFNELVKLHNRHLHQLMDLLRLQLPLARWVIFDAYSIMMDAFKNPSKYGVKYPHEACCGAGGKYNYVDSIMCGQSGYVEQNSVEAKRCEDPSLHIIWDSIHPVESFGQHMAKGVLNGIYLQPPFNITHCCAGETQVTPLPNSPNSWIPIKLGIPYMNIS